MLDVHTAVIFRAPTFAKVGSKHIILATFADICSAEYHVGGHLPISIITCSVRAASVRIRLRQDNGA